MNTQKIYTVQGKVTDSRNKPITGLCVHAFDQDFSGENPLGQPVMTGRTGKYKIKYYDQDFRFEGRETGGADIIIRIYGGGLLLFESKPRRNAKTNETINLKVRRPQIRTRYAAQGRIVDPKQNPVQKVTIRIMRKSLREEVLMGMGLTDEQGSFKIEYDVDEKIKDSLSLFIRITGYDDEPIHETRLYDDISMSWEKNIVLKAPYPDLADFDRVAKIIKPLLSEGISLAELEQDRRHDDIDFLEGKSGVSGRKIRNLSLAFRLEKQSGIDSEFWYALLSEPFHNSENVSSIRAEFKNLLTALPQVDETKISKSLAAAFNDNIIKTADDKKIKGWIKSFGEFSALQVIDSQGLEAAFAKDALKNAGITVTAKQHKFSKLYKEHKIFSSQLAKELKRDSAFKASEVDDLHTTFKIAEISRGNFDAVKKIRQHFKIHKPDDIRELAKKSEREWIDLAGKQLGIASINLPAELKIPGGQEASVDEIYGRFLARQFRDTYPTATFMGGLERALESNTDQLSLKFGPEIKKFLQNNQEFELLTGSIDEYAKKDRTLKNKENIQLEFKAAQRMFKLMPDFKAANEMLKERLHSAQQIYRMGESQFVRKFKDKPGFTKESASLTWNRAADTYAAAVSVVAELKSVETGGAIKALASGAEAVSSFPNWNNLFNAGDMCECEPCRSVYSPAAYFADLMMFLRGRNAKNSTATVKDILLARRPDLGFLELNCENAHTTLPYIDVVNEVLEDAVAGGENDLELTGLTAIDSDPDQAKTDILAAFLTQEIELNEDLTLSQVGVSDEWVVHTEKITYLLKKKATANYFAVILRNTKAGSEELRANPQYVNPKAYEKLKTAKYPAELPFDLFAEEVGASFSKVGLKRWELMQTFLGNTPPNNPTPGDIAAIYFDISVDGSASIDEKRIILEADTAGQPGYWGESTAAAMINKLKNVKDFLLETKLEYNELLALLDLKFINPDGSLHIVHHDVSCDTDRKEIQPLNAQVLDRINRFLRLWRKLGWKMWELDLAIWHASVGKGLLDEPFLIQLMHLAELQKELGKKATVETILALLGNINTETHFTELHKTRQNALYQDLFLNTKLIHPIDEAFYVHLVDTATSPETITAHYSVVLAALRIRESELDIFKTLKKVSDGAPYINDELTLNNLSFLFRHSWLSKQLKVKAKDWPVLLKLFNKDIDSFPDAQSVVELINFSRRLSDAGFKIDEANYILTADSGAKSAVSEDSAARILLTLRQTIQAVYSEYDAAQYPFLTAPPSDTDELQKLLTELLQKLGRDDHTINTILAIFQNTVSTETQAAGLPGGFSFPSPITNSINITYIESSGIIRFTGRMTDSEKNTLLTDPQLAAVSGMAVYQEAIDQLYWQPRLITKFYEPRFTAPLAVLPAAVDFKHQLTEDLAPRITYNAAEKQLELFGILTKDERALLESLSADVEYLNAVGNLFIQPKSGVFPANQLWLEDADLTFPLDGTNLAANLAAACQKVLTYLKETVSENEIINVLSSRLGLTETVTEKLISHYALPGPDNILTHIKETFALSQGVVDYANAKNTFDVYYWLSRVAAVFSEWKLNRQDLDWLITFNTPTQTLDLNDLPLDETLPPAPAVPFLRIRLLLFLKRQLAETDTTLYEIFERLHNGDYAAPADFAADVELMTDEEWKASDVETFVSTADLTYPDDYLLAETWERLEKAIKFINKLNAGTAKMNAFANAAVSMAGSQELKQLIRSKYGPETWLTISTEIQDTIRQQKRDSLVAWLLVQAQPADAPSNKWENPNDLYAYYLLDVEMNACMLTSRLVQGSGSIQLFVNRCFLGLEPEVEVKTDGDEGDSAWKWWKWMRKYRVWEANRKVFLYPENWIEPELRLDKSPFFKDLENELLQKEVDERAAEDVLIHYLEKLYKVAQLEIAGFYHEDDADLTYIHVFGRTPGGEPHEYFYRRFDYRQWTPWEKVELDIKGDYLIPLVINKRLFIHWPVFTEVPDEEANKGVDTPELNSSFTLQEPKKKLRIQLAVSEFRNGIWTPKKVSKDYFESGLYSGDVVKKHYTFFPVDRSHLDKRIGIKFSGNSVDQYGNPKAYISGTFELFGCSGVPEKSSIPGSFKHILEPDQANVEFLKHFELFSRSDHPENDFSFRNNASYYSGYYKENPLTPVLIQTPQRFKVSMPWHLSFFDRLFMDISVNLQRLLKLDRISIPAGAWLPYFYADKLRTFFVLPVLDTAWREEDSTRYYYPEIKGVFKKIRDYVEGLVYQALERLDLGALTAAQRSGLETFLGNFFNETPPFSDKEIIEFMVRFVMQFFDFLLGILSLTLYNFRRFHFKNYYHPFICEFSKKVRNPLEGIPGLMSREVQLLEKDFKFLNKYVPTPWVLKSGTEIFYPKEDVDFTPDGSYSSYNWELFFHIPLLIGNALSKNQRFEEAREWYHFIFNPLGLEGTLPDGTSAEAPQKFWITKPFFLATDEDYTRQRIDNILRMLAGDTTVEGFSSTLKTELEKQVEDWRYHPFEPHRIAQYRQIAYQKTTVMKYLDNLIAWGDFLFRQDSMESINEAIQLYILAAELLGPRPKKIPPQAKPAVETFNELEADLDAFSNALILIENYIPVMPGNGAGDGAAPIPMLYFCIPQNEKLLEYWDTVADRLYKIRNCMNIEGQVRQLSLFEPPIDPAALVKAVAGGLDIGAVLSSLNAPLPYYRFPVLLQKANELTSDLKALGAALLTALERKDAEELALLRQNQEIQLQEAVKLLREIQIEEAKENIKALERSKITVETRRNFYRDVKKISKSEELHTSKLEEAHDSQNIAQGFAIAASIAHAIPNFSVGIAGFGGSPNVSMSIGGSNLGSALQAFTQGFTFKANGETFEANMSSITASRDRRWNDWKLQERLANREIIFIDKQIDVAKQKLAAAIEEFKNQGLRIEQSKEVEEFYKSKYTNKELYQWMIGQISRVYFQSYQMAYDLAKRAERCYRFELGKTSSDYIQFGYWDSMKKGLLSADKLQIDLRKLETAYMEQNKREFELTKHVSLSLLNPLSMVQLKETGQCFFSLPEEIFDLDYPGHYFRRIKSISISLPCISGPYTTISCTLRLINNHIRHKTNLDDGYEHNNEEGVWTDDTRFIQNNIASKAIATSMGQNDSGMFELNFRDERYLPFEGAGVISDWSLELFNDIPGNNPDPGNPDFGKGLRQFDFSTINDVIVHLRYTAREEGGLFKNASVTHLRDYYEQDDATPGVRLFNLKSEFPVEWHRFLHPQDEADGNVMSLNLTKDVFPFKDSSHRLKVNSITLLARCSEDGDYDFVLNPPLPSPPPDGADTMTLIKSPTYGNLHFAQKITAADGIELDFSSSMEWIMNVSSPTGVNLEDDEIEDIFLILGYEWDD